MQIKHWKPLAGIVAALIVIGLVVSLVIVSPMIAHQMEPYRRNPPADTTINTPTAPHNH